jgi:hypothetical protein
MSYVSKRFIVDDVTVVALKTDTSLVISGGVVTDHGQADSKVDVTECKYLYGNSARVAAAVASLAVTNGQVVVIDPADNTIKAAGAVGATIHLATVAVAGGVCTPTDHRRQLDTVQP